MIFQRTLLLVLFNLFATSVDSFSVSQPSILSSIQSSKTSTCLRAEEESETETTDDEVVSGGDSADAASDILNSPAFLTRKLEVLKSDIEKIDEEIAETQQQVEAGKAEWGPQLEDLQREVSAVFFICFAFSKKLSSLTLIFVPFDLAVHEHPRENVVSKLEG